MMNKMKRRLTIWTIMSIAIFYISWGIPQFIKYKINDNILSNIIFSIIFTGVVGCCIPIFFKNKLEWTFNRPGSKRVIGFLLLVITILFGTLLSGAIFKVIELEYSWIIILKYVLLFFPMSLAISLFAFLMIPNTINGWMSNKAKGLFLVISIALFFFFAFYTDTLFRDIELAGIMGFLGLLFGLCYYFLRNFWMVYFGFFITMLINTLADNKYDEYQFWIVITSTLFSLIVLGIDLIKNRRKNFA
jgi:hypothetical protein